MAKKLEHIFLPPPSEAGFINAEAGVGPDGRMISGIRKKVRAAAEERSMPEEHVIAAEGNLKVRMDEKGFYKAVSPKRNDRIKLRHDELCRRYPEGYRRMCETADGRVATWQSQKDTEQPPDTVAPESVNRPPLSTLGDDDETPLTGIRKA